MPVLDLLCRDPRITRVTLVEPDVYKPHNVERHLFPAIRRRRSQGRLAAEWLQERRPDLKCDVCMCDLLDPARRRISSRRRARRDLGICAADNEAGQVSLGRT